MRPSRTVAAMTMVLACGILAAPVGAQDKLVSGGKAKDSVQLRDVRANPDGSVDGVLLDTTSRIIRDVRLMIHHNWLWKDEKHPGDDNPGRVEYFTVPTTIDPHGTIEFHYKPSPALPTDRTDGRFETRVEVVGYTEIGN